MTVSTRGSLPSVYRDRVKLTPEVVDFKVGLFRSRSGFGRALQSVGTYVLPGDTSVIRHPIRSGIAQALTPGGGGAGGTRLGRRIGGEREYVRCPPGFEFGGRFGRNCGRRTFELPAEGVSSGIERQAGNVERTVQSGLPQAPRGNVREIGAPRSPQSAVQIQRNANIPTVGAKKAEKQRAAVSAAVNSVVSSRKNSSLLVRRDGVTLAPSMGIDDLGRLKRNADMENGIFVVASRTPENLGDKEIPALLASELDGVVFAFPGGGQLSVSKKRPLTPSDRRRLAGAFRRGNSSADQMNYDAGIVSMVDASGGALEYSGRFPGVKRPYERVTVESADGQRRQVARWIYEIFLSVSAPQRGNKKSWTIVESPVLSSLRDRNAKSEWQADFCQTKQNLIEFRTSTFQNESDFASFVFQVKRVAAVWDADLPPEGGFRCPPGTRYGGRITDRFGRNCGWNVGRRLANRLERLGRGLGEGLDDRRDRRVNERLARQGRRQERRVGRARRGVERAQERLRRVEAGERTPVVGRRGRDAERVREGRAAERMRRREERARRLRDFADRMDFGEGRDRDRRAQERAERRRQRRGERAARLEEGADRLDFGEGRDRDRRARERAEARRQGRERRGQQTPRKLTQQERNDLIDMVDYLADDDPRRQQAIERLRADGFEPDRRTRIDRQPSIWARDLTDEELLQQIEDFESDKLNPNRAGYLNEARRRGLDVGPPEGWTPNEGLLRDDEGRRRRRRGERAGRLREFADEMDFGEGQERDRRAQERADQRAARRLARRERRDAARQRRLDRRTQRQQGREERNVQRAERRRQRQGDRAEARRRREQRLRDFADRMDYGEGRDRDERAQQRARDRAERRRQRRGERADRLNQFADEMDYGEGRDRDQRARDRAEQRRQNRLNRREARRQRRLERRRRRDERLRGFADEMDYGEGRDRDRRARDRAEERRRRRDEARGETAARSIREDQTAPGDNESLRNMETDELEREWERVSGLDPSPARDARLKAINEEFFRRAEERFRRVEEEDRRRLREGEVRGPFADLSDDELREERDRIAQIEPSPDRDIELELVDRELARRSRGGQATRKLTQSERNDLIDMVDYLPEDDPRRQRAIDLLKADGYEVDLDTNFEGDSRFSDGNLYNTITDGDRFDPFYRRAINEMRRRGHIGSGNEYDPTPNDWNPDDRLLDDLERRRRVRDDLDRGIDEEELISRARYANLSDDDLMVLRRENQASADRGGWDSDTARAEVEAIDRELERRRRDRGEGGGANRPPAGMVSEDMDAAPDSGGSLGGEPDPDVVIGSRGSRRRTRRERRRERERSQNVSSQDSENRSPRQEIREALGIPADPDSPTGFKRIGDLTSDELNDAISQLEDIVDNRRYADEKKHLQAEYYLTALISERDYREESPDVVPAFVQRMIEEDPKDRFSFEEDGITIDEFSDERLEKVADAINFELETGVNIFDETDPERAELRVKLLDALDKVGKERRRREFDGIKKYFDDVVESGFDQSRPEEVERLERAKLLARVATEAKIYENFNNPDARNAWNLKALSPDSIDDLSMHAAEQEMLIRDLRYMASAEPDPILRQQAALNGLQRYENLQRVYQRIDQLRAAEALRIANRSLRELSEDQQGIVDPFRGDPAKIFADRRDAIIAKRGRILGRYLRDRYQGQKPWQDSSVNPSVEELARMTRTDPQRVKQWIRSVLGHEEIVTKDGTKFRTVFSDGDIGVYSGEAAVSLNIEAFNEATQEWERVGKSSRSFDFVNKSMYSSTLFLGHDAGIYTDFAEESKNKGFQTVYNPHAWTWAKASGFKKVSVTAANDGTYVWGRVGYRPRDQRSYEELHQAFQDELTKFRDGDPSIIKDEESASLVGYLLNKGRDVGFDPRTTPAHFDFTVALGDNSDEDELKRWFQSNVPFYGGTIDLVESGLVHDDPTELLEPEGLEPEGLKTLAPAKLRLNSKIVAPDGEFRSPGETRGGLMTDVDGPVPRPRLIENSNIRTKDEAVAHVANGGNLSDVPNEFIFDAIDGNASSRLNDTSTRYYRVQGDGAVGDTRIFVLRNPDGTPGTEGYVLKADQSAMNGRRAQAEMGEVAGFNIAAALGFVPDGATWDGETPFGGRWQVIPHALNAALDGPDGPVLMRGPVSPMFGAPNYDSDAVNADPDSHPGALLHLLANFLLANPDRHNQNGMTFRNGRGEIQFMPIDFGWAGKRQWWTANLSDYMDTMWESAPSPSIIMHAEMRRKFAETYQAIKARSAEEARRYRDRMLETYDDAVERASNIVAGGKDAFVEGQMQGVIDRVPYPYQYALMLRAEDLYDVLVRQTEALRRDRDSFIVQFGLDN